MKMQDVLTKWSLIKLVANFEKGKFLEDILQKALDLFKMKHPKSSSS
jgi:hypothetical protein